jgi:hypothetical protein
MNIAPVRHSAELERVLRLPRRTIPPGAAEQLARQWTRELLNENGQAHFDRVMALPENLRADELQRYARARSEGGEGAPIALNGLQAQILFEAYHCKGVFVSAAVGAGKTLVSWLLPLVLGAQRPLILVPASVLQKTHDEFGEIARFWRAPRPPPQIESYQKLGGVAHAALLCDCLACTNVEPRTNGGIRPDCLIADECDLLRNPEAAVTKRVARYMARHPSTMYCSLTGTVIRKSLRNFARHMIWSLKWNAPIPLSWVDLEEWCEALDVDVRGARRPPGALRALVEGTPAEGDLLRVVRTGIKKRFRETPGVVVSDAQSCDKPLTIRILKAPDDPVLEAAFAHFRAKHQTLDGWDLDDPLSVMRHATELGCGFYYKWDPRPPEEWLEARREAAVFVREAIEASTRRGIPLDSKGPVYAAFPHAEPLVRWKEIEPTFKPNSVPVPVTASVLGYAMQWIQLNGPALIWVQHEWVGRTLSGMTGVPYFGPEGKDVITGRYIMKHSPRESAIVSIHANKRGRNLQAWFRNLVIGPPQAATDWEQAVLGRTHRQGQRHAVLCDVLMGCAENVYALERAIDEAAGGNELISGEQKLQIATYDWSHFPRVQLATLHPADSRRPRWVRPVLTGQS